MTARRKAETARLLAEAADLIEANGWYQGHFCDHDTGCLCAGGAIRLAATGDPEECNEAAASAEIAFALRIAASRPRLDDHDFVCQYLYAWNDDPGRTKAEVIATLRQAADDIGQNVRGVADDGV